MNIINKIKYLVEYYIICHGSISKYWAYQGRKMSRGIDRSMREVMRDERNN